MVRIGNRVPRDYFITSGVGESDVTVHAGSYHLALRDARIEQANQIMYSSILPGKARRIRQEDYRPVHGEVMETITATATAEYGEVATAGIIFGWLYGTDGYRYGGLVCEYNGPLAETSAKTHLHEMLQELYTNGYDHYRLGDIETYVRSVEPKKMYGTALVAICFTSYDVPLLTEEN